MEPEPTEIEPVETTEESHPHKKRKKVHLAPESEEELRRRGIVYVSRMPPNMKPRHLRTLLSEWGVVTRVYCSLESEEDWTRRKKRGGNRRRQFREAWVEFESKRKAYNAALALNGQKIGTRKKDQWFDDMWCIKFLKHFKWYHLTEELKLKNRVQEKMLQVQVSQAKHEANIFLENREKAITDSKIQENREAKEKRRKAASGEVTQAEPKEEVVPKTQPPNSREKPDVLDDDFLFRLVGQGARQNEGAKEKTTPQTKKRKRDTR